MVILQFVAAMEERTIGTTEHQDLAVAETDSGACHQASRRVTLLLPLLRRRHVLPNIFQKLDLIALLTPTADHVDCVVNSVTLRRRDGHAARVGPGKLV